MIPLASNATWQDVALTFIAALPGLIAAMSSLKNGKTLKSQEFRNQQIERKIDVLRARR